jgi:hypothetical protein
MFRNRSSRKLRSLAHTLERASVHEGGSRYPVHPEIAVACAPSLRAIAAALRDDTIAFDDEDLRAIRAFVSDRRSAFYGRDATAALRDAVRLQHAVLEPTPHDHHRDRERRRRHRATGSGRNRGPNNEGRSHMSRRHTAPALVGALAALCLAYGAGAAEIPPLLAGNVATMAGTHVSCKAGETYVTCKKVGGLTATISQAGVVRVTRDSQRLTSAAKPRVLRNNDGFELLGTQGLGVYCHVYVAGKPTMSCSVDDPKRVRNSHGFDMTDSSVVVFRYDQTGLRHTVKTIPQRQVRP